jgi:hypothetical protein
VNVSRFAVRAAEGVLDTAHAILAKLGDVGASMCNMIGGRMGVAGWKTRI